jgi:hypothetical protein
LRRPFVRDRDRRTTEAFRCVRDTATRLARLRADDATADARAVGVVADILGALVGLLDAYDARRAAGQGAELRKAARTPLVGALLETP